MNTHNSLETHNLTPLEQSVFLLLFACMRNHALELAGLLNEMKMSPGDKACRTRERDVSKALARLLKMGLVRCDDETELTFICAPLPLATQRELFHQAETKVYITGIERVLNAQYYRYYSSPILSFNRGNYVKPFCILHEALLDNRLADARTLLRRTDNWEEQSNWLDYCKIALPAVLNEPDKVAPGVLLFLFPGIVEAVLAACVPTAELTRIVASAVPPAAPDLMTPSIFLALCAWHTWTASFDGLGQLERAAPHTNLRNMAKACRLLLAGDAETADALFAKAMRSRRQEGGVGERPGSAFVTLAAFAAIRANKSATRIRSLIRMLDGASMAAHEDVDIALEHLDTVANRGSFVAVPQQARTLKNPLDIFISALQALFQRDEVVHAKLGELSLCLLHESYEAGYGFMAVSLVPCIQRLLPDNAEALVSCQQILATTTAAPLWAESCIVQPWEQALKEIVELLPKTLATAGGGEVPIASHIFQWIVILDDKKPDDVRVMRIGCRLLKRLKSGKWSNGRNLTLDRVMFGEYDEFMDEQDLAVKAKFHENANNHRDYYYDLRQPYWIMPALIGHPRVYLAKSDMYGYVNSDDIMPIQVVRGEYAIEIGKANNKKETALRIPWCQGAAYETLQIVQERSDVYTVYEKSALHQRLAAIVTRYGSKNRLVIPAEGGEALKRLLTPLAQVIGIKGEFDTEAVGARVIEGQINLRLRARFANAILHLDLVNQPALELPLVLGPGTGMRKTLSRLEGETVAVCRDLESERKALATFKAACPSLAAWAVAPNHWEIEPLQDVLTALDEAHALADSIPLEWPEGDSLEVVRPGSGTPYVLNAAAGADFWLEIGGDVTLDDGKVIAFTELLKRIDSRTERFIPLSERRFLCLTRNLARQMELLAKSGDVSGKVLKLPPAALPLLDAMATSGDKDDRLDFPALVRERLAEFRQTFKRTIPLPASLTCELRPYQKEGFVWLARLAACGFGACLADDMGLGKTIQMLALLTARAEDGPSLVVAPTSVSRNWADEAARFAPALRLTLLAEAQDRTALIQQAGPYDVIVCSYGLLTFEEKLLTDRKWNIVILDEAQAVKNHLAKRTRIVKRLKARMRTVATGTPVENNLGELWSLFDFINPGLLGSHSRFDQRFCNADGSVSPLLKRLTVPFILRRLKAEVLDDLPPKTEVTLTVTLEEEERSLYESCRREALAALEAGSEDANRITILAHLTKLRRACCHPSLVLPTTQLPGQKAETFMELVTDLRAGGHRALVFSQFVGFLDIIRQRLDQAGVTYQYLDGSTPLKRRTEAVERFQRGEGDLFLISLKAGGTGLNLTAANFVILLDPWWNPAAEMQAADRAHRIGQRLPVTIYRLVTADTVEERVVELHAHKRALAEELLDGTGSTRLSASDLVALFRA